MFGSGVLSSLVSFSQTDLATVVAGGTVTAATLRWPILRNAENWGTSGRTIDLHRLTQSWLERNVTWECRNDTAPSNGSPDCPTEAWEMDPAGPPPYASTPTATVTITNSTAGDLTLDVTADVQAFLAGSASNYGWLLKKTDEGQPGKLELGTREGGHPPVLELTVAGGDSGPEDSGPVDSGPVDSGPVDSGPEEDSGPVDGGPVDSGPADTGPLPDIEAPTWPSGSALTLTPLTSTSVRLTWTAADDDVAVTGYRVFQDDVEIATLPASPRARDVTGLERGRVYLFRVEARDAAGNESTGGPTAEHQPLPILVVPPLDRTVATNISPIRAIWSCDGWTPQA